MRILAIDTATEVCGVAICDDGRSVAQITLNHGLTHARYLMDTIQAALKLGDLNVDQIDGFVVTRGPGSFTGLRIGIGTAKGLAMASGKPLVGVSTLLALAHQVHGEGRICAALDARRGELYWCFYHREGADVSALTAEQVGGIDRMMSGLDGPCEFIGSGVCVYGEQLSRHGRVRLPILAQRHELNPGMVAWLGWRQIAGGAYADPASLGPVYLRPADAMPPRKAPA
jgi:tRNA threonylcarbamoyladenosine biosynthesis protein TsaB